MNRKGFTLIELLATILILSAISIVVVVSVTASLGRREIKECEEQKELAINAAKIYFSLNDDDPQQVKCEGIEQTPCVYVKKLIEDNYFSEQSKFDRITCDSKNADCIASHFYITLEATDKHIEYKFNGECMS